jgi:hypothetical protein
MSVNVSDRNSKLEVLSVASRLYDECESLALREFGIRSVSNPLRAKYQYLLGKESDPSIVDDILRDKSLTILRTAEDIVTLIDGANAIYPRFKSEFETRLELQNLAIAACSILSTELSNVVHLLDVNITAFKVVNDLLQKVSHLLVEWRKSDRKLYKKCL